MDFFVSEYLHYLELKESSRSFGFKSFSYRKYILVSTYKGSF